MAELENRDDLESEFARKLARLSARHRRELIKLLGDPPNIANVPEEFWTRCRRETDNEMAAIILLIFASSVTQHGWLGDTATILAEGWARQRAADFATQWVNTTRGKIESLSQQVNQAAPDQLPIPIIGQQVIEETPLTKQEIREKINDILGPDRVALAAENETTLARHQGSELAIENTVGISEDDIWITTSAKPCEVCGPLDQKPRIVWGLIFPDGPPEPHPRCVCNIEYANAGVLS